MSRSTDFAAYVPLPRASATEYCSFGNSLVARFTAATSPPPAWVRRKLDLVVERLGPVETAVADVRAAKTSDARLERDELNDAWVGFRDLVAGHLKLKKHPSPLKASAAAALDQALFANQGLAFLAGTSHEEVDGTTRSMLETLAEPTNEAHVQTLDAAAFVDALRAAHTEFGVAAGFLVAPEAKPRIDEPTNALCRALREYVGVVLAWGSEGEAERAACDQLLQPWVDWELARPTLADEAPPEPTLPPEPGETPLA